MRWFPAQLFSAACWSLKFAAKYDGLQGQDTSATRSDANASRMRMTAFDVTAIDVTGMWERDHPQSDAQAAVMLM
jgi:hypothetical protein